MGKTRQEESDEEFKVSSFPPTHRQRHLMDKSSQSRKPKSSIKNPKKPSDFEDDGSSDTESRCRKVNVKDGETQTPGPDPLSLSEFLVIVADQMQLNFDFCCKLGSPVHEITERVKEETPGAHLCCSICSNYYDHEMCLPVCLPCGHTMCKECSTKIRVSGKIICPFDRKQLNYLVDYIPVNYLILQMVEQRNKTKEIPCKKHGHPVIGYCLKEEELVCGTCMFQHKSHECYPTDSEEIAEVVEEKRAEFVRVKDKARAGEEYWNKGYALFEQLLYQFFNCHFAMSAEFNERMSQTGIVIPISSDEQEYKALRQVLMDMKDVIFKILGNFKYHREYTTQLLRHFDSLSRVEQLGMKTIDIYSYHDFQEFLRIMELLCERMSRMPGVPPMGQSMFMPIY